MIKGTVCGFQLQLVTGLFNLVTTFLNFVTAFLYPVTMFLKLVTGLLLNTFISLYNLSDQLMFEKKRETVMIFDKNVTKLNNVVTRFNKQKVFFQWDKNMQYYYI